MGAGLSSQPVLLALPKRDIKLGPQAEAVLQQETIAPATAPWVGARIGIFGDNEAGLTYSGHGLRLDGRHAFLLSKKVALSIGLGGQAVLAGRPTTTNEPQTLNGGGVDVPLLLGWMSTGGLYAGWIGPRAGITWVSGMAEVEGKTEAISGRDVRVGLVGGLRLGFRHLHVALEIAGDWHAISGKHGTTQLSFGQLSLTPAGALITSF